jgi:signal transduction histidine kinase
MKEKIKILLIEDDEDDYILTKDTFSDIPGKSYELDWVSNYQDGLEAILKSDYDLYLLDYRLGKETGLQIIKQMSFRENMAPLILLTGQGDRELAFEAMEAGAADFLIKTDLKPDLLDRSIRYAIQRHDTINKLRKKEEELQQLNANLEQIVLDRTKELNIAHEGLKKSLEIERKMGELKSRFVSMASHEFKTPLTSILSSASLLERYTESSEQEKRFKHVVRIKSSVQNLTNILNDFLSLEKIESGSVNSAPEQFTINEFIFTLLDELTPLLTNNQIVKFYHKGEITIKLDKHLLKNILINLLSNAIKYSPLGKDVSLKTICTKENLKIEITDQGIGIPDEDKQHMFERFFRAANASNIQGTGLGLTIVKRYVEMMGGEIGFTSTLNVGTTFKVVLPILVS